MAKLALLGGNPLRTRPFTSWPQFDESEVEGVAGVIRSGKWWRVEGEAVDKFEREFAASHGAKFGIAVTNGTTALENALASMGIGPGDEVIVPSYTFVATATSVVLNGATPVFVDVEPDTYNIDPDRVEEAITGRTRAIIPVHFAGYPADMDRIMDIAGRHGLKVVEDAAHAHGGAYKGRMLGSIGHASTFSFQASKNMTSGEGGIILTSDEGLASRMFSRHSFGRKPDRPWYEHYIMSTNARMTEMQAALLLVQHARLAEQTEQRAANAKLLDVGITQLEDLMPMRLGDEAAAKRAYHIYMLKYAPGIEGVSRDLFVKALQAEGIPITGGYTSPLYKQPLFDQVPIPSGQKCPYRELFQPNVESAIRESLLLPQNTLLGDRSGADDIIAAFDKVIRHADELRGISD